MNCWQRFFGQPSLSVFCLVPFVLFMKPLPAHAAHYAAIYTFKGFPDGDTPAGPLVADSQGNLYGETHYGGASGFGTVFELSPPAVPGGGWTETILHSFTGADGAEPSGGLTLGADGSVYGVALYGGLTGGSGSGVVFKLANSAGWPLTILHNFGDGSAGGFPATALVFGPNGLLYGTTLGTPNAHFGAEGMIFSVSPLGDTVEYQPVAAFNNNSPGQIPVGLTLVPAGAIPGLSGFVGTFQDPGFGSVFVQQILAGGRGPNVILYQVQTSADVWLLNSPTIVGMGALKGMLIGTGCAGGADGLGGIYQVTPSREMLTTDTILYSLGSQPNDGSGCSFIVQKDLAGRLAGVSVDGGAYGDGTFFELIPPAQPGGVWTEQIDVSFESSNKFGGGNPEGAPLHLNGHYYGVLTTIRGGQGAVYELTP